MPLAVIVAPVSTLSTLRFAASTFLCIVAEQLRHRVSVPTYPSKSLFFTFYRLSNTLIIGNFAYNSYRYVSISRT